MSNAVNTVVTHSNNGAVVSMRTMTAEQVAFAASLSYWTVLIPWSDFATKWHPTDRKGPFAVLSRGAFKTLADAQAWADAHLQNQPCTYKYTAFEMPADGE